MGTPLMPWQRQVADVATEVNPDGSWAYRLVVVHVQRQSGKTTLFGPAAAHRCATKRRAGVWWTAQTRQDARDSWADMVDRLRGTPLAPSLTIREANGSEAVTFPTASRFRVFAPTPDALHGKASELVGIDEGWAFDPAQGAALESSIVPTFTTTGGQLWVVSTAGTAESTWFRAMVERGRAAVDAGRRDTVAYFEWSLDPEHVDLVTAGLDPDAAAETRDAAMRAVLDAHPAAGYTLRQDALDQAAATMSVGGFLRAYGNVWTEQADRVIPPHLWEAARRHTWPAPDTGNVALGVDVSVDGADAAIVAAWRDTPLGPLRVDVVAAGPGTGWVAGRVQELRTRWRPVAIAHDASGPVLDVADQLARDGVELLPTKARDYSAACAGLLRDVTEGRLEHPGAAALDDAVEAAGRRTLGDAWAWSRRQSSASIAPLVAATVARWGYDHQPPPAPTPVVSTRRPRPRVERVHA